MEMITPIRKNIRLSVAETESEINDMSCRIENLKKDVNIVLEIPGYLVGGIGTLLYVLSFFTVVYTIQFLLLGSLLIFASVLVWLAHAILWPLAKNIDKINSEIKSVVNNISDRFEEK